MGLAVLLTRTHVNLAEDDCASQQAPPVVRFYKPCKGETSIGVSVTSCKHKLNKEFNVKAACWSQLCCSRMTSQNVVPSLKDSKGIKGPRPVLPKVLLHEAVCPSGSIQR